MRNEEPFGLSSPVVTICTVRLYVKKLRIQPTQFVLSVPCDSENKQSFFLCHYSPVALLMVTDCSLWGTNWIYVYTADCL